MLQGLLDEICELLSKCADLDCGVSLYFHFLKYHLVKMLKILRGYGISINDVDQSSFELSNLVMEHIKAETICRQAKYTKNSEDYTQNLEKKGKLDYQKVLNFKENMNQIEKNLYKDKFDALQILLHLLRKLTLSVKYQLPYIALPNFDRKRIEKAEESEQGDGFLKEFKDLQISEEQYQALLDLETTDSFDYEICRQRILARPVETHIATNNTEIQISSVFSKDFPSFFPSNNLQQSASVQQQLSQNPQNQMRPNVINSEENMEADNESSEIMNLVPQLDAISQENVISASIISNTENENENFEGANLAPFPQAMQIDNEEIEEDNQPSNWNFNPATAGFQYSSDASGSRLPATADDFDVDSFFQPFF